jgi:hypothetical protein
LGKDSFRIDQILGTAKTDETNLWGLFTHAGSVRLGSEKIGKRNGLCLLAQL